MAKTPTPKPKTTKPKAPKPAVVAPVATYVLLDRSGSMSRRWAEAISSVNTYAADLKGIDATLTVALFDSYTIGLDFDIVRDSVAVADWEALSPTAASPRGNTPLYDAIGRLCAKATTAAPDRAVIVIVTDGEENASREMSRDAAKAALDACRAKGWQVVFLGADFDAMSQAAGVGTQSHSTMNASAAGLAPTMSANASRTRAYAMSGETFAGYSGAERAAAMAPSKPKASLRTAKP